MINIVYIIPIIVALVCLATTSSSVVHAQQINPNSFGIVQADDRSLPKTAYAPGQGPDLRPIGQICDNEYGSGTKASDQCLQAFNHEVKRLQALPPGPATMPKSPPPITPQEESETIKGLWQSYGEDFEHTKKQTKLDPYNYGYLQALKAGPDTFLGH
jgi:hypothetical protein